MRSAPALVGSLACNRSSLARARAPDLQWLSRMWSALAACIDAAHASLMAAWVLGLPLLFWRRWPKATRAYAVYAIAFVVLNVASRVALGGCFLTTLSRACWQEAARGGGRGPVPQEWFTVRMAEAVFRLTPTHRGIKRASEALILVTAIGVLTTSLSPRVGRRSRQAKAPKTQPVPNATRPRRMTTARVPRRPNVA
jgi:hypothetical protein